MHKYMLERRRFWVACFASLSFSFAKTPQNRRCQALSAYSNFL